MRRARDTQSQAIQMQKDNWNGVQRRRLTKDLAAHGGNAKRLARLAPFAEAKTQRRRSEECRGRRHHDWTKSYYDGTEDRFSGLHSVFSLRLRRGVDHQDRVLRCDADRRDHADQRNDGETDSEKRQRQHGACESIWMQWEYKDQPCRKNHRLSPQVYRRRASRRSGQWRWR